LKFFFALLLTLLQAPSIEAKKNRKRSRHS
jgi:hypothetical protein